MVLRWYSMGLAVMILAVVGCEGTPRDFEETSAAKTTTTAPPAAEVPATTGKRALPKVLEKAEEASEDVQEDIAKAKWDDAAKETQKLRAMTDSIKQTGAPAAMVSAYDSAVTALAENVQRRDQIGAGLAANAASRAVIAMMADYQVKVPVEVGYMDVDARDVEYHAMADKWSAAEQSVADLRSNYAKVQAHVAQKNASLDNQIRTEIEQLSAAVTQKDAAAVRAAADKLRDEIDDIEDTY